MSEEVKNDVVEEKPTVPETPKMSIKDFLKFNIITAQIKEAKEHPNADRLYVLKVDTGSDVRQLVAGVRAAYTIDQLVDRKIVMIENLEPAVIRGEESCGMLLAVGDENGSSLLMPDRPDVALGSKIR